MRFIRDSIMRLGKKKIERCNRNQTSVLYSLIVSISPYIDGRYRGDKLHN